MYFLYRIYLNIEASFLFIHYFVYDIDWLIDWFTGTEDRSQVLRQANHMLYTELHSQLYSLFSPWNENLKMAGIFIAMCSALSQCLRWGLAFSRQ
jgi:hypothetical protein